MASNKDGAEFKIKIDLKLSKEESEELSEELKKVVLEKLSSLPNGGERGLQGATCSALAGGTIGWAIEK